MCMEKLSRRESVWNTRYAELKAYIEKFGQLPDKHRVDNRALLNWWKYNRRLLKNGKLDEGRILLITNLGNMRKVHC